MQKRSKEAAKEERRRKRAEARANGDEPEGDDEEDDVDAAAEDADAPPEETIKQANRSGPYVMCRKAGIGEYGLNPLFDTHFHLSQRSQSLRHTRFKHMILI